MISIANHPYKLSIIQGTPYYINLTGNNYTLLSPTKRSRPMSLAITLIHNKSIYIAADTRSSQVDSNNRQLSYFDGYKKIVPSKTGRFLLLSTGINELTTDRKTVSDVMHDIDLWLELNPDRTLSEIAQYTDEMFLRYINENYEAEINRLNIRNDENAKDKLRGNFFVAMAVAGFENSIHYVYVNDYLPNHNYNQPRKSHVEGTFRVFGEENIIINVQKQLEKLTLDGDMDVAAKLKTIFDQAKQQSSFIGGNTDIYKISLVDGKECIENLI